MSTCTCGESGSFPGFHAPWCIRTVTPDEQVEAIPSPEQERRGALDVQVGGDHYKGMAIQPVEFIHANSIPYFEGNVIKYVSRWRSKNGLADLEKAKHYLELLIELETRRGRET